ncbi:MAG: hypothetical protein HRT66_10555 [Flavobacteriaceae bacterium]|nr:hypothetical protein [Flavobacteriaceae bacterium]
MNYKIRTVLDTEEDVVRTVLIDAKITLEQLHKTIVDTYGFDKGQMASFYTCDDSWEQEMEIPLVDMSENLVDKGNEMRNYILEDSLAKVNDKLLYVYDFINMWTVYVELVGIDKNTKLEEPKLILSVGDLPKQKEMPSGEVSEVDLLGSFEDEFKSEFDEEDFESLDDYDNY